MSERRERGRAAPGEAREIVAASELEIGMFVAELDRPWIESPFLIQGFLIEDQDALDQLRGLCRFVCVDRLRSVGAAHRGRAREDLSSTVGRSLRSAPPRAAVSETRDDAPDGAQLPGFLELMRLVRQGRFDELPRFDAAEMARLAEFPPTDAEGREAERSRVDRELVHIAPRYAETQVALEKVLDDVRRNVDPDLGKLREGVEGMVRSVARNPDALLWLTRLRAADEGSYQNALHTSVHMMIFARSLGMGFETTGLLGLAGMLLDVGKLRLPARLLRKESRLSRLEYEIFKTHVDYSLAILRGLPGMTPALLEIVARHHERFDGSGYPGGLLGDAIGLHAEIAGVVDSYTAMTNRRGYHLVYSTQRALEDLIRLRDSKHRAELVDQLIQCVGIYPVGALVELNTGEVGVVIGQNRIRRLRPRVMVLLAADKTPNAHPAVLDLLYDPLTAEGEPYLVRRALPPDAYGIDPQAFYLA